MVANRSLAVTLDGEPLSFPGRMRVHGKDELSLYPALFTLELWNLPEEMFLRISRAREITVSHGDACLVSGQVRDAYRQGSETGTVTAVSVSLGLELWEAAVSLTVPAGTSVSETVQRILEASGTGIPLLSFPDPDVVSSRPRSFFGRAAECISEALDFPLRPMLTPSGLMILSREGFSEAVRITGADLADTPAFAGGSLRGTPRYMILNTIVSGWRPGQAIELEYKDIRARGIVTERSVDADTGGGAWRCELLTEVLNG